MRPETPTNIPVEDTMPRIQEQSPPRPPKVELERQQTPIEDGGKGKGKETASFYDSGSSKQPNSGLNTRVESPVPPPSGPVKDLSPHPAVEEKTLPPPPVQKQEQVGTEKEAVDFSTEKIAVNLDLYGPSTKKNDGEESEDEYVMSSTAYPGQAWEPSYYGWS